MLIQVEDVAFSHGSSDKLANTAFQVKSGEFLGIIGPNGSGKSTLLRKFNAVLKSRYKNVLIDRNAGQILSRGQNTGTAGDMPRIPATDPSFTVLDTVLRERANYSIHFEPESTEIRDLTIRAMKSTNTLHLSSKTFDDLDQEERQRIILTMSIVQNPEILMLDEPVIHLSSDHQLEFWDIIKTLNRKGKVTVMGIFHDVKIASRYCDKLLLLRGGMIVSAGAPDTVLTPENIMRSYHLDTPVTYHPFTNTPRVPPYISPKRCEHGITVHVVCGGGSGSPLINILSRNSFNLAAGVLNVLDSDYKMAMTLDITVVGELPFSKITRESHVTNVCLMKKADVVLLTDFPVGFGNFKNIEAVEIALNAGIPVIIIDSTPLNEKDFTAGKLRESFARLASRQASFVRNTEGALEMLETTTSSRRSR